MCVPRNIIKYQRILSSANKSQTVNEYQGILSSIKEFRQVSRSLQVQVHCTSRMVNELCLTASQSPHPLDALNLSECRYIGFGQLQIQM